METKHQLVIEGDLVTKITVEEGTNYDKTTWRKETRGKTVKVAEWLEPLLTARGEQFFVPQLSEGQIIARKTKGAREVVVIEFAPKLRRIIEKVDQYEDRSRQLAFPFVYLIIRFYNGAVDKMYVFYRNERAEDLSAELCLPNLPNVYDQSNGYKICTGSMSGMQNSWPLSRKVDWLVRSFWDSQFNKDLISNHWDPSQYLAGHPRSFSAWEEKSRSDPSFILKIPWRPLKKTIQQVLDEGVK